MLLIAIFLRVILSWTSMNPENPVFVVVHEITEPILSPIRNLMPRMAIDLSPMIASFLLIFLAQAAARAL